MPQMPSLRRLPAIAVVGLILGLTSLGAKRGGCATTQMESSLDQPQDLRMQIKNFHRFLRWEMFPKAAELVHPAHRETFRGRYEEYGDDLDITALTLQRVDRPTGQEDEREAHGEGAKIGQQVRVEVEQKWYVEPDMTLEETIYVEIWELTPSGWRLRDRMRRKEWKRRQKEE